MRKKTKQKGEGKKKEKEAEKLMLQYSSSGEMWIKAETEDWEKMENQCWFWQQEMIEDGNNKKGAWGTANREPLTAGLGVGG